jgi:hypothetical protein
MNQCLDERHYLLETLFLFAEDAVFGRPDLDVCGLEAFSAPSAVYARYTCDRLFSSINYK